MKIVLRSIPLILVFGNLAAVQDPGWPRQYSKDGAILLTYQPQVDEWNHFTDLDWRMAISLTPADGKPVIGVVAMHGQTAVDSEQDMVQIHDLSIRSTSFSSLGEDKAAQMQQVLNGFLPPSVSISMRRLVGCVPKPESSPAVPLRNDPPQSSSAMVRGSCSLLMVCQ